MPHYRTSHHAIDRLTERFPDLAKVAGHGLAAAQWLARLAQRAHVVAQQAGMDLMLCLEMPMAGGLQRIYLPVTPLGHDIWIIRTVLTEEHGLANLAAAAARHDDAASAAWRARKGFTRPYVRAHHAKSTAPHRHLAA